MALLRKILFWLHLTAGCIAGAVILIMSVTGVVLAYEKQIIAWFDRGFRVAPPAEAKRMPVEALLARMREATPPFVPTSLTFRSDPALPVSATDGKKTFLFNPYTGERLGEPHQGVRTFMRTMIEWHRYLGRSGDQRPMGKAITGACNLAFVFLIVSGFYLWLPRTWSATAFKAVTRFGRGLSGRARDWNWHNVIGFWCAVPLFVIAFTGMFFNYKWANNALYAITRSEPPSIKPPAPKPATAPGAPSAKSLDDVFTRAEQEAWDWRTLTMRLGSSVAAPVSFNVERGTIGQPHKKLTFTIDRTGEVTSRETYESYNLGRRVRLWIRWLHTGEAGGLVGQAIALVASAGAVVLVWTGIALAVRRLLKRRAA
jgi:uncharacterized iron-regulated membrane protein